MSLAVIALLGVASAHKKSLSARAKEDDEIMTGTSEQWSDLGQFSNAGKILDSTNLNVDVDDQNMSIGSLSKVKKQQEISERQEKIKKEINERETSSKNQELFSNINAKLNDKTFIESAIENTIASPLVTNKDRPDTEVRKSTDLFNQDNSQHDRNTDRMGGYEKVWEDDFNQGHHNTGTTNAPMKNSEKMLPDSWTKVAPSNQPTHLNGPEFKKPDVAKTSSSGISLAYLTVDSEEHATRFIKDLFKNGLIAAVQLQEGGFQRSYLKFGSASSEVQRTRLEITTSNDKVAALIEYVNLNNPTMYDYPVPDITVLPITTGNPEYIKWVKEQTGSKAGIKWDTESDYYPYQK